MNSLPPTVPSASKVKIRSKTTSFKRPYSCNVNETTKKESKGSFFNLRKGSSNSKLNEEIDNEESSENNVYENEKIVGRMQGRKFDSDNDDDDIPNEETSVTKMDKLFNDYNKVVNNPALLGHLLKYLTSHNMDYNDLLFYLVVQHYKATVHQKDLSKEVARFANEIITTFVLEKSILKIDHKIDTLAILDCLKAGSHLQTIFDQSFDDIYHNCIKNHIDKIRQSIKHGLYTLEVSVGTFNFDSKMNFFNDCIKTIVKNLEDKVLKESLNVVTKESKEKEQYMSDIITAVKTSLATIYYYFTKKEKDDGADNVSIISNKHLRNSFMKSTESLQMMTNCVLDKQPIFCSKMHKKPTTHSFFKKGKSTKGHNFQEKVLEYPECCMLCEKLLWGINPQGLYCSNCQGHVHRNCKDHVRTNCYKDARRFPRNMSNITQPTDDDTNRIGDGDAVSLASQNSYNNNSADVKENSDSKDSIDTETNNNNIEADQFTEKQMATSVSSEVLFNAKTNCVISTATIYVTNSEDKPVLTEQEGEVLDNVSEIHSDRQYEFGKKEYELKNENHNDEKSHVRNTVLKYDQKNISRSQSNDDMESRTMPRPTKRGSEAVYVQDLVADSSAWANDPDMNVEETFEANKELEFFTKHLTKDEDKGEYTRLLVLMEFHHKIKFTVMTLKRFDYLLIKQWPNDGTLLFKTLSLNNIIPLYELIKTLDSTIEQSKTNVSYSQDMAENVHHWLVADDESNMQKWLKYSIDLCCTNSLNLVKNAWKECRGDVKFSKVLNKRHNKMLMVEQLANMRPLLFNLPLIVGKIFKDLVKFSKFKDETKFWKEIRDKFKTLPTFIDEHCMPLVQLINSGTIVNNLDRTNWSTRLNSTDPYFDYILDFPKTAFHHKLFDIQEIKISNFRESGVKNMDNKTPNAKESVVKIMTPAIFVKDVADVYAICYDNMLVLLQKENEKYHLKQFKATDSKMNPILMFGNVHTSRSDTKGGLYELTLMFIDVAVLAQVSFQKEDVRSRWLNFMNQLKVKQQKNKIESKISENTTNKYLEINDKFKVFSQFHSAFFKDDNKLDDLNDKNRQFLTPMDGNECLIGTSFDAINILNTCYENLSVPFNEDVLHNLLSLLSTMENRISYFKNQQSKSVLNSEEMESELRDMLRENEHDTPELITQSLSQNIETEDNSYEELNYREENDQNHESLSGQDDDNQNQEEDIIADIIEEENMSLSQTYKDEDEDKLSDIIESNSDEDMLAFVDEYIRKIIEEAQTEVNKMSSFELDSEDHQDDLSLMQLSSVMSESST